MNLAITGASGFIGSATVSAALERGHQVQVLLRRGREAGDQPWAHHPNVSVHAVGLEDSPELVNALRGVETLIHVAAALRGNFAQQYADSVDLTRQLLQAMRKAQVRRLIGISSFAVYDYVRLKPGSVLDERSSVESNTQSRSVYAQTKCLQEELFRAFGAEDGNACVIIRPGIVYDKQRLWDAALGSRLPIALGPNTPVPLVHVDDVATAIVLAAETTGADGAVVNLVEDQPPLRKPLLDQLSVAAQPPRRIFRFPWLLHRMLASILGVITKLTGGRPRLPGLLNPVELAVRFKPLQYDTSGAHRLLNWQPQYHALDVARNQKKNIGEN